MDKRGRPFGTYQYDLKDIMAFVDSEIPQNTTQIMRRLKKVFTTIHRRTVLSYLLRLEKQGYIKEICYSKKVEPTKRKIRVWMRYKDGVRFN